MATKPTIDCFIEELPDGTAAFRYVEDFFSGTLHPEWGNLMDFYSKIRNQLYDDIVVYRCPHCHGKLFLTGETQPKEDGKRHIRLHFKHKAGQQSPDCPFRKDKSRTKAEAERDGHANKEQSPIHYKIKNFVAYTLIREYPEAHVDIEKRIRTTNGSQRQPDINVKFPENSTFMPGREVDFEIQVSYILIARVKERKEAHKLDGRPVLWIFDKYEDALFQNDIIERNELNAFVLDDPARARSMQERKLYLHVYYPEFKLEKDRVVKKRIVDEIVCLDALQFDEESCELFYKRSKSQREKLETKAREMQAKKERQEEYQEKWKQFVEEIDSFIYFDDYNINVSDIAEFASNSEDAMNYLLDGLQQIIQNHKQSIKKYGMALSIMSHLDHLKIKKLGFDLWPIMYDLIYEWSHSVDDNQSTMLRIEKLVKLAPKHVVEIINMITSSPNYICCHDDWKWAKERIESFVNKYVKEDNGILINTAPKDDEHQTRDCFEAISKLVMLGKIWLSGIKNKAEFAALYLKHQRFFLSLQSLKQGFVSYGKFDNFLQLANNVTIMSNGFYVPYLSTFLEIADYYYRDLKSHRNKIHTMIETENITQSTDLDNLINLLVFDKE